MRKLTINTKTEQQLESLKQMTEYIKEHTNVMEIVFENNFKNLVKIAMKPNIQKLKEMFEDKAKLALIFPLIKNLSEEQLESFAVNKSLELTFEY